MSGRAINKYNRYHEWWAKIEKRILRLAIVLFFILYSMQLLNFIIEQRNSELLTTALGELEGTPYAKSQTQLNMGTIELSVTSKSDCSKIEIYLNGEYYNRFDKKSVSLNVKNNDIIEVSGIKSEFPATIKITSMTDNIVSPEHDITIKVNNSFKQVGRVRLK